MCVHAFRESKEREGGKRERECVCVSNLVFYAQSTSTVISERDRDRQTDKATWCFTPSQPVQLFHTQRGGAERERERKRERDAEREREKERQRETETERERESVCHLHLIHVSVYSLCLLRET